MKIYINGNIVDESQAKISVFDRSYLFGEGIFETFRSYKGVIPFFDKHIQRMEWAATFVGMPSPQPSDIRHGIYKTLKENRLKDARIKILISCLNQGFRPQALTEDMPVQLVIGCEDFKPLPQEYYKEGVGLVTILTVPNDPMPLSSLKSTNWLAKMLARREIAEKKCFDGLFLSVHGYVTECSASNLFWIEKGELFTAPATLGLLGGVTREIIMELAQENKIHFSEKMIKPDDLKKVDEIFITASTMGVMPVVELDYKKIAKGKVGKLTQKIQRLYEARIQEEIEG